jgi:pyruvate/2-oxoacid:ferredoxin oxidoreductase beta subunit
VKISKLAVETKVFPLYEYRDEKLKVYKPAKTLPVSEFLSLQGRFAHLREDEVEEVQRAVDERWESLLKKEQS